MLSVFIVYSLLSFAAEAVKVLIKYIAESKNGIYILIALCIMFEGSRQSHNMSDRKVNADLYSA